MSLHAIQTHPSYVDGCFGCKVTTVAPNTRLLRSDNKAHTTQAELKREIYEGARRTGRDIQRAGKVSPTSGPLF